MQQVTLWLHVSTVKVIDRPIKIILVKVQKGSTYLYLKENIIYETSNCIKQQSL